MKERTKFKFKVVALTLLFILGLGCIMWFTATANAADATFSWLPNSETDLAGYKIHYGPASKQYTEEVDVGLPDPIDGRVKYKISEVPENKTYFSATAYDTEGHESDYSDEAVYDPTPNAPADFRSITVNVNVTVQ